MLGSCVTSAVLISAVRALLGCRACVSFMLPGVLICFVTGCACSGGASVGAGADPAVFYIAVMGILVGYLCGVGLQLSVTLYLTTTYEISYSTQCSCNIVILYENTS
jgi:hypothetical protein